MSKLSLVKLGLTKAHCAICAPPAHSTSSKHIQHVCGNCHLAHKSCWNISDPKHIASLLVHCFSEKLSPQQFKELAWKQGVRKLLRWPSNRTSAMSTGHSKPSSRAGKKGQGVCIMKGQKLGHRFIHRTGNGTFKEKDNVLWGFFLKNIIPSTPILGRELNVSATNVLSLSNLHYEVWALKHFEARFSNIAL